VAFSAFTQTDRVALWAEEDVALVEALAERLVIGIAAGGIV
jgi:hypothetical protein